MTKNKFSISNSSGQSLVEILIGLAIGALIIGAVSAILASNLRSSLSIKTTQIVSSFSDELLSSAKSAADFDWHNMYNLNKGSGNIYHISSSTQGIISGAEIIVADGKNFTRYFYVENVNRDSCGTGDISANATTSCSSGPGSAGVFDDPSTQKVTVVIKDSNNVEVIRGNEYLTRSRNYVFNQNNWSGGSSLNATVLGPNDKFSSASSSVDYSGGTLKLILP